MSTTALDQNALDPRYFRDVLGNVPTSVVAITALDDQGRPAGMTVGTFISVSLDPPLVAFLPDKSSSTFPKIRAAGKFCANVLTSDQEHVSRILASKKSDKFEDLSWAQSQSGTPHLSGAAGWIDCTLTDVHDAGDHYIAVGQVDNLRAEQGLSPLIFLRGGFGRFASTSLGAHDQGNLHRKMRAAELARPMVQELSEEIGVETLISTVFDNQLVVIANALPAGTHQVGQRLGQRMPYSAPIAAPYAAWSSQAELDAWQARKTGDVSASAVQAMVERVRKRGWSVVLSNSAQVRFERAVATLPVNSPLPENIAELHSAAAQLSAENYEPDDLSALDGRQVRYISAPVFDEGGSPILVLTIYRPSTNGGEKAIEDLGTRISAAASRATELLRTAVGSD